MIFYKLIDVNPKYQGSKMFCITHPRKRELPFVIFFVRNGTFSLLTIHSTCPIWLLVIIFSMKEIHNKYIFEIELALQQNKTNYLKMI